MEAITQSGSRIVLNGKLSLHVKICGWYFFTNKSANYVRRAALENTLAPSLVMSKARTNNIKDKQYDVISLVENAICKKNNRKQKNVRYNTGVYILPSVNNS